MQSPLWNLSLPTLNLGFLYAIDVDVSTLIFYEFSSPHNETLWQQKLGPL